jgi:TonB family protein
VTTTPDSTNLEVLDAPQPDYPLEAAAKKIQGQVVIRLHILETGEVESTEIVSGEPLLAKAAADTMRRWKFKPFIKGGKPIRIRHDVPFTFSLKGHFSDECAAALAAQAANATHHIRLSTEVMVGNLIHTVDPEYPEIARRNRVKGTVLLYAVIGEDGRIRDVKALCGPPILVPAALDAIRQWRYRPYELNGAPVAVETTINVEFHI